MTNNNKPHDYLLTFWFTGEQDVEHLISRGLNEEEALQLAEEIRGELPENIKIEKVSDIPKVTTKEITIQEIMKTSFSNDHLRNSINLFEIMIIQQKVTLEKFLEIFSPYGYYRGGDDKRSTVTTINFNYFDQPTNFEFKMTDFGFRYLPKKNPPFGHDIHRYDMVSQSIGTLHKNKRKIVFKTPKKEEINFLDFLMETRKLIPDFPIRLEKVMISCL